MTTMVVVPWPTVEHPFWKHDCDQCVFLGSVNLVSPYAGTLYDLYYCPQGGRTVVARYSSQGPDYTSGLEFADRVPSLIEAANRAIAAGLLNRETLKKHLWSSTLTEEVFFQEFFQETSEQKG